jgi:rod shape-determining protein MreC
VILRKEGDVAVAWPLADPSQLDYAVVEQPFAGLPPSPKAASGEHR